jgi:hypothetical protein
MNHKASELFKLVLIHSLAAYDSHHALNNNVGRNNLKTNKQSHTIEFNDSSYFFFSSLLSHVATPIKQDISTLLSLSHMFIHSM